MHQHPDMTFAPPHDLSDSPDVEIGNHAEKDGFCHVVGQSPHHCQHLLECGAETEFSFGALVDEAVDDDVIRLGDRRPWVSR
jgi:hypothetical protein